MLIHKLNRPMIGTLLAISVAAIMAVVIWKRQSETYPLGVKSDRLNVTPHAGCWQVVWPYGCDWQPSTPSDKRTRSRFGGRGRQKHGLMRYLS